MMHTTEHCDLCGEKIVCTRENGWIGSLSVQLKPKGNFFQLGEKEDKTLELCNKCGVLAVKYIQSLEEKFTLDTLKQQPEPEYLAPEEIKKAEEETLYNTIRENTAGIREVQKRVNELRADLNKLTRGE